MFHDEELAELPYSDDLGVVALQEFLSDRDLLENDWTAGAIRYILKLEAQIEELRNG